MVVSVQHFREVTNGYEKTTSGLWTHKGKLDANSLRGTGSDPPRTGTGVEVGYYAVGPYGYISALDRDAGVYKDLNIQARSISLLTSGGGTLNLPNGSVTSAAIADGAVATADIAPNAVSALIGSYFATPTWSTTTTTWIGTVVSTGSIACSGALLRIQFSGSLAHSALGGNYYTGLMLDNGALYGMSTTHSPGINYASLISWTVYYTPTVGNHTFQFMVLNASGGTLTLRSEVNAALYVTEQRR